MKITRSVDYYIMPADTPNFVVLCDEFGTQLSGDVDCISVSELTQEELCDLADQWVTDLFVKAGVARPSRLAV